MSFGRWRQQLHVILAMQWLIQGASVQSVAIDLGYESASSFVVMFRKAMGASPARYMTQRLAGSAASVSRDVKRHRITSTLIPTASAGCEALIQRRVTLRVD